MTFDPDNATLLNLDDFVDRARALELAGEGCPDAYTSMARDNLAGAPGLRTGGMVYMAFVSRMRGLHEGAVREIAANNPHSALPLMRAWAEVITIGLYVLRNPDYVKFLMHGPRDGSPAKKSFEAMFHAVKEDVEQMKPVYQQLSEYSHFGPLAIWNVHSIDNEDDRSTNWTDAPRWRDEQHFQIACAQAHELAEASRDCLRRLGPILTAYGDLVAGSDG